MTIRAAGINFDTKYGEQKDEEKHNNNDILMSNLYSISACTEKKTRSELFRGLFVVAAASGCRSSIHFNINEMIGRFAYGDGDDLFNKAATQKRPF